MEAMLVLEDGTVFRGQSFGAEGERIGEVILNTAVVGYQEMVTDPANAGKILILTYPLIGNYGVSPRFNESKGVWLSGLVVREKSRTFSNWQARASFADFVKGYKLIAISDMDTRTLAVHLREKGEMRGVISTNGASAKSLLSKLAASRREKAKQCLPRISVARPIYIGDKKSKTRMAVLDLGITRGIISQLETLGLSIVILPYNTGPEEILRLKVKGLIISNGPEEDAGLKEAVDNVKALIKKLPLLGISTGHQVLARALGAKITKMKLGHHGANYPLRRTGSYKGEITFQNHSYVVDGRALGRIKDIKITAYNVNDHSVEEMESKKLKFLGVQYYPVSPGFNEVHPVFKKFLEVIGGR